MDKKPSRSAQAPTKGVGTESKKTQDVANGKCWPRGGRKREPTGGGNSFPTKNEPSRKPVPQRNKSFDKRPKPRGENNSWDNGRKENTWIAGNDAELESAFIPRKKNQNLNYLLNFHYVPRGDNSKLNSSLNRSGPGSHRWLSTQKHKYNKEQFLQANCQFVVNSDGDYKLYMNNPDALVDWDLIEQVHVQVSEFPSCPICLYPPVAAKMTRCGHVYCWSCILHYLALSHQKWRKCPICYEAVHKNNLKSVIVMPHSEFNVNEYITLRLMKRAQGSLTAIPVDEAKMPRNSLLNMSEKNVNTVYSKLLLANSSEVMSIIERERNELTAQLIEEDLCPEKCFIEEAINQLNDREKIVLEKISNSCEDQKVPSKNKNDNHFENAGAHVNLENLDSETENRMRFESVSSEGLDCEDVGNVLEDVLDVASNCDNNDNNVKYYYFYQAADGQHIYLHAINVQMLEHMYGSLENCPTNLNGRIVEKEGGSMTEELRRRLRCLQHLPVMCQFEVAEIQLRPPIVSKETLNFFQDQLDIRKKRRQRRTRDEKRLEKRIEAEENKRLGRLPEVNVHIESLNQFPQIGAEDPVLGAGAHSSESTGETASVTPPISERSHSPSIWGSASTEEQYAGPSFAKMLATGKSKPPSWPGLRSPSQFDAGPHPSRLINVTGSQSTSTLRKGVNTQSDSEPDSDGYAPAPAYNQSFSDAIALALEKATISENNSNGEPCLGGKKKKKKKQKVLFATSMTYSGK